MIPNSIRPIIGLPRTMTMLLWLKATQRATGWKYFFGDFGCLRCDGGALILGGGNWIEAGALIQSFGGTLSLGARTFVNRGSIITAKERIDIGHDVLIADHCTIIDHDHALSPPDMKWGSREYVSKPIAIGDFAWIASHAVVLKGVTIGHHAVIAAGAVVTRDVPPGEIWGGVPARRIRSLDPGIATTPP